MELLGWDLDALLLEDGLDGEGALELLDDGELGGGVDDEELLCSCLHPAKTNVDIAIASRVACFPMSTSCLDGCRSV